MPNSEVKTCQNCKASFEIDAQDFDFYRKIDVPPPTWCPQCRLQRRMTFFNERALYKRECDMCGKSIVSMYAPGKKLIVYCNSCWWSDKWDSSEYGRDYDSSKPFIAQLRDLLESTPQVALESNYPTLENSEYVNHAATSKNCYLIYTADECENVLYSEILFHDKDSMDGTMYRGSELCYGLINSDSCYKTFFSEDCESCQEVYFSKDMIGCSYCFGCKGLRSKKYHIWNKPYNKEEYQKKISEFRLDSRRVVEKLKKEAVAFWQKNPHKFANALRNLNVTGDYVYSSKNSKNMYIVREGAEDCRYCSFMTMPSIKDSYDCTLWGNGIQRTYDTLIVGEGSDMVKFSERAWPNARNVEYCIFCISSSNIFGCANVRNKQYCILNKQYSQDEFEKLKARIIKDMSERPYIDKKGRRYPYGEFFPPEMSLFGYNETYANDFFPLTEQEALAQGYNWSAEQTNPYRPTLAAAELPDSINNVDESILKEIIECRVCKKAYRIVPAELSLLKRFGLPMPDKCPNCRYRERLSRVNPPVLFHRKCQCAGKGSENGVYANTAKHRHEGKCPNEFETPYAPDRPEIVYCEACYQREVV